MLLACHPLLKRRTPNNYIILYAWDLFSPPLLVKSVGEMEINQNSSGVHHLRSGLGEYEHVADWKGRCVCAR